MPLPAADDLDCDCNANRSVRVGAGDHTFETAPSWPLLPPGSCFGEVVGTATDSRGRVFVFDRGQRQLQVFEADGTPLGEWSAVSAARPHGITIGPDDAVYLTDDVGHRVHKLSPDGKLLLTLNAGGAPSDTGAIGFDYRTIRRAAGPFHLPTNVALSPAGEIYVADGYGNARIHRFTPAGRWVGSWGAPGSGPGQFHVPHGIAIDAAGTVYVADRENCRIQLFSPSGELLREWDGLARPCEVFIDRRRDPAGAVGETIYVAELGFRAGMWPGAMPPRPQAAATGGRVSVLDLDGNVLCRWGGGVSPCSPGDFFAPHDICVDARGDVYVSEVAVSAGGNRGLVPRDCHTLQKFVRVSGETR